VQIQTCYDIYPMIGRMIHPEGLWDCGNNRMILEDKDIPDRARRARTCMAILP